MAESVSSTLSPTEEERYNQGTHELELHYGGELDLHQYRGCDKNPGHEDFKPMCSLRYSKKENIDLVHFSLRAASLTTKLMVRYVSLGRSKENMKKLYNKDNYPLSAFTGKKKLSVGSGCVTSIDVSGDEGSFPCPLENCPHSTEPHQVYGYIIITTAAHVVFDDDEAKNTTVEFFDDDPEDKRKVESAQGVKVKTYSVEGDFREFMCVTHSKSLFERISHFCSPYNSFEPDFHFGTEKTRRILRLFELITVLHLPPNLQVILGYSENTSKRLKELLSTWQELQPKERNIDESIPISVENFLNAAESVSEITGLQNSMKNILYQSDAMYRDKAIEELYTIVDIETTAKRIALIWILHLLMPKREISKLLDSEDIYISLFDTLHRKEWFYSEVPFRSTRTDDGLSVENCFKRLRFAREILLFIQSEIDKMLMYQQRTKLSTKVRSIWIFSQLKDILPDMIIKCFPQVTGDLFRTIRILNDVSSYLDQVVRTLSREYKHVPASASQFPKHNVLTEERYRHLTELWTTSGVISNHDLLSKIIGLRLKICGQFMKIVSIAKIIENSNDFYATFWTDIDKKLHSVEECLFHCKQTFIEELKLIPNGSDDVFEKQTVDTLVIHFSHPHGQSRQITVGEHFSCNTHTGHYEHIYTVPTCMGCSGGPVWIIPKGEDGEILWDQVYGVPHSGCYDRGNKLNHSSSWTFLPPFLKQEPTETNTFVQDLGADTEEV